MDAPGASEAVAVPTGVSPLLLVGAMVMLAALDACRQQLAADGERLLRAGPGAGR
jgi:hypothetical protein